MIARGRRVSIEWDGTIHAGTTGVKTEEAKNEEAKNEDEDEGEEASRLLKFTNFTPVTQL